MADKVDFQLVAPERLVYGMPADMVVVPGSEGDFGVLPDHAPLISSVRTGVIEVYEGNEVVERLFVAGGFAEVTATRCTVLAEEAMPLAELTRELVEDRIKAAERAIAAADDDAERSRAEGRLALAEAMRDLIS